MDYFEKMAKENKVYFLKAAEIEVKGDEEKIRKYIDKKYLLDKYRIVRFMPKDETNPKEGYEVQFFPPETRTEAHQRLIKLIGEMEKDGLKARIITIPHTIELAPQDYPFEEVKYLEEKYGKEYAAGNRDILELEYGITLLDENNNRIRPRMLRHYRPKST